MEAIIRIAAKLRTYRNVLSLLQLSGFIASLVVCAAFAGCQSANGPARFNWRADKPALNLNTATNSNTAANSDAAVDPSPGSSSESPQTLTDAASVFQNADAFLVPDPIDSIRLVSHQAKSEVGTNTSRSSGTQADWPEDEQPPQLSSSRRPFETAADRPNSNTGFRSDFNLLMPSQEFATQDSEPSSNQQARDAEPEISKRQEVVTPDSNSGQKPGSNDSANEFAVPPFGPIPDQAPDSPTQDNVSLAQPGAGPTISREMVLQSVIDCYPLIDAAIAEIETAEGKIISSWGEFDRVATAHSISQPLGFYQTYRNGAGLAQPLFSGGEVYGTYRIGDGNFEPWFGERETNEAGEFKAGFSIPLLKDRDIDKRRAELWTNQTRRDQTESNVRARLLMYQRFALQTYWQWVAAGRAVEVQRRLIKLAELRVEQIERYIEVGELAPIARIDNERFIAKRKLDLIKAQRKFIASAIKLSLFMRDEQCVPVVADVSRIPAEFPGATNLTEEAVAAGIRQAQTLRPELAELEAMRNEALVALRLGRNQTLAKVDLKGFAGQDIGGETSSKGDKTPFELNLGVFAELPLQRRGGIGKIQSAEGKLAQIEAKRTFTADKIKAEVIDAATAIDAAVRQIEQSSLNVDLTNRALAAGQRLFEDGDVSLIELNIYETAAADAQFDYLQANLDYFLYRALYQTAIVEEEF